MSQVIENIVINAAKYTAPGGEINLLAEKLGERLSIRIRDNGKGIPTSMLGRIFDMFIQGPTAESHPQAGLGVGLSVVRRLVELHGGSVHAVSDGKTGSEFIVDLPMDTVPEDGEQGSSPLAAVDVPVHRILIIDDNTDASEALALLLTGEGHEVQTCSDGVQGIDAAATFRPDVVLLDIGLPGMDGYEVARRLRASDVARQALLIAVTGYGQPSDRRRSAEAGFSYHMVKPVEPAALIQILAATVKPVSD